MCAGRNYGRTLDWLSALLYVTDYAHEGAFTSGLVQHVRWPQLWSLAVEEHYYLTYPLLFVALMKAPARLMAALIAVLIGALAIRIAYFACGTDTDIIYSASETRIDSIAYGCAGSLALWCLPRTIGDLVSQNRSAIACVALAALAVSVVLRDPMFRDTLRYSMQGMALMLLFLSFYASTMPWIGIEFLEWSPLKWIGRMSYGAYLWHEEIGGDLERLLHLQPSGGSLLISMIEAPIFCAVTFFVAWVSFELFQRPLLALRHRFA